MNPATTALLEQYISHLKKKAKAVAVLAALNRRVGEAGDDARGESLEHWLLAEMTIMARRKMLTDVGVEYAVALKNSKGHPTARMHGWVNLPSWDGTRARPESRNVAYVQFSVAFHNATRDAQLARWVRDTDAVTRLAEEQRGGGVVSMLLGVGLDDEHVEVAVAQTGCVVQPGVPICTATGARVGLWALSSTCTSTGRRAGPASSG